MALPHDGGKHEKIINVIGIYLAERDVTIYFYEQKNKQNEKLIRTWAKSSGHCQRDAGQRYSKKDGRLHRSKTSMFSVLNIISTGLSILYRDRLATDASVDRLTGSINIGKDRTAMGQSGKC